jgi:hypothetical protein
MPPRLEPRPRRVRLADRRCSVAGFSILELLVALLLISVTATASIWVYFSRAEVTLDNAARLLGQDLLAAQGRALRLRMPITIAFAPDGDGYRTMEPAEVADLFVGEQGPIVRHYARDAVFEGVRVCELELGPSRMLTFDATGMALSGGHITLSYRGEKRIIQIEAQSGRIHIPDLSPPWDDDAGF